MDSVGCHRAILTLKTETLYGESEREALADEVRTMKGKTMTSNAVQEAEQARESLLELFEDDTSPEVYTLCRRVSASGMTRQISLFYIKDNQLLNITWNAGKTLGWTLKDTDGSMTVSVGGGGMDMGFHIVYSLSRTLYPSTEGLKDSGYRLSQRWI